MGTKLGIAASFLHYKLGSAIFEDLDAHGTAEDYALQLLHPLIRSRNNNLFLQASADYRRFDDQVDALPLDTRKDVAPYATLGVVGDFRDTVGGGAISNYSLGVVAGRLKIKDEDDIVVDQAELQGRRQLRQAAVRRLAPAAAADQGLPVPRRQRPVGEQEPRQLREVQHGRPVRRARLSVARVAERHRG